MKGIHEALEKKRASLNDLEAPAEFEGRIREAMQNKRKASSVKTAVYNCRIYVAAACILALCIVGITWYMRQGIAYPDTIMNPANGNNIGDNAANNGSDISDEKGHGNENSNDIDNNNNNNGMSDYAIGDIVYVKGPVGVWKEPGIYGVMPPEFTAYPGNLYELVEQYYSNQERISYSKIKLSGDTAKEQGLEGWLPSWYLTGGRQEIFYSAPAEMIAKEPTRFYPYPDEGYTVTGGPVYELEAGKVVHVVKEYNDWYCIDFVTYDSPMSGPKWVKTESLQQFDSSLAIEGYLKAGAKLMDEQGNVTDVMKDEIGPVKLINTAVESNNTINTNNNNVRNESRIMGMMAGGWYFYIDKLDFVPNPYDYLRKARVKSLTDYIGNAVSIELLNIENELIGRLEGEQIKILADIILNSVDVSQYPKRNITSEPSEYIVLNYTNGQTKIPLAEVYMLENIELHEERFENEPYFVFTNPNTYNEIIALFGAQGPSTTESGTGEPNTGESGTGEPGKGDLTPAALEKAWTDAVPMLSDQPYYFEFSTYSAFDALIKAKPREMLISGLKHPNKSVRWYSIYKITEYLNLFSEQEVRDLLNGKDKAKDNDIDECYDARTFALAVLNRRFDNDGRFVRRKDTEDYLFYKYHEAAYNDGKVWMIRDGKISLLSVHDGSVGTLNWSPDGKWAVVNYGGRVWGNVDIVNTSSGKMTTIVLWKYIVDNARKLGYTIGANMRPDPYVYFVEFNPNKDKMLMYIIFNDDSYSTQQCTAVYNIKSGLFEQVTPVEGELRDIKPGEYSW